MGTIYIEEYSEIGSAANADAPVQYLNSLLALTKDATTSSTAESVTLNQHAKSVSIYAVEAHRVCMTSDTSADKYTIIPAGQIRDFGVKPGDTLYYELDA